MSAGPIPLFLNQDELRELTGFAIKAKQIEQLRRMGIPFRINGCGRPIVTRRAVEGGEDDVTFQPVWQSPVLMPAR